MTSRSSDQFRLRLPDGMRERLKVAAAENRRSMNAEIVHRLDMSFRETVALNLRPPEETLERINALAGQIASAIATS